MLSMWLSGIIAFTNSNGDSASPWNMPLWNFSSAKLFHPAVNSTQQIIMVFSIKIMTASDILRILLLLFTPLEFFISSLADRFLLEFEWRQVSSSLLDSTQYSGCFQ